MSWREKLRPASFRGVPFKVDTAELTGGRRGVTHEYAFRDEPFREDLGRKVRGFTIDGYVIGKEYLAARDALIEALEAFGPGDLVHPYYGARRVAAATFRVRESTAEGGMARFSIDFEQTPDAPAQPTAVPDAAGTLRASAKVAKAVTAAEFGARYSPGVHLAGLAASLRSAALTVEKYAFRITMATQQRAVMRRRVDRLRDDVSALVSSPASVLSSLTEITEAFTSWADVLAVADFSPGIRPVATTSNRRQEQTNFDALRWLIQRLAVVRAAELAVDATFDSFESALAARSTVTARLDEQAEVATDDAYPALLQLRADLVKAVPGEAGDLPRLVSHTPPLTVPSLVLVHQLYGDLAREADVLARNRVKSPAFVAGGRPLEVLSRG